MRHPWQGGFTLLEMMVALAIVALVAAIALPYLGRDRGAIAMKTAARQIAGTLREARSRAVVHNRVEFFAADVEDGSFALKGTGTAQRLPRGVAMHLYTTLDQANAATRGTIRFYPDGSSTGGGLRLDQNGRATYILVDWLTGRTRILDERPPRHAPTR